MFELFQNFVNWINDFFSAIVAFLNSLIQGTITMFKAFPMLLNLMTTSLGYVPSIFTVFISIGVIIYIVYLILGRETGGSE